MASTYEDTVFDFDLNFLRQTSNNTVVSSKLEKQRKAVLIVKKKTIATDSLIRKYYAKRDVLDQTEKNLLASKEECKNICIDYRNALETCSKLEKDVQILNNTNKELEEKCFTSESQYGAVKSHANQLQILVKEHETQIQTLKIENKLEKANFKNYEKKVLLLQKEKQNLVKHICLAKDVIFGKKKVTNTLKLFLDKYKSSNQADDSDDSIFGEENDDDIFEDIPMSPCSTEDTSENNNEQVQTTVEIIQSINKKDLKSISDNILKRDYNYRDDDCNNEVVSVDTGRGSSLAFSDGDKSFHSPDYYINGSPLSPPIQANKETRQLIDVATSPLIFEEHSLNKPVQIATSPIIFEDQSLLNQVGLQKCMDICVSTNAMGVVTKSNCNGVIMVDKALSPIKTNYYSEKSTSPIRNMTEETATSPITTFDNIIQFKSGKTLQEKACLELNNSNNTLCKDSDCEIEMILSKMRFNHELITPMPTTPAKPSSYHTVSVSSISNNHIDHSHGNMCQDAALVKEENKKLQASITDLAKEIMNIKSLLKNQLSTKNNEQNNNIISNLKLIHENNDVTISDDEQESLEEKQNNFSQECLETVVQIIEMEPESYPVRSEQLLSNMESGKITEEVLSDNRASQKSVGRLMFEDSTLLSTKIKPTVQINELSDIEEKMCNSTVIVQPLAKENHDTTIKTKKITQLEKLKRKMLPKSKIRRDTTPVRRLCLKAKKLPPVKKKVTESDSSASLNDKSAYEKACKVMADLKSKKQCNATKVVVKDHVKIFKKGIKSPKQSSDHSFNECEDITPVPVSEKDGPNAVELTIDHKIAEKKSMLISDVQNRNRIEDENQTTTELSQEIRKRLKRASIDKPEIQSKRILRSSTILRSSAGEDATSKSSTFEMNKKSVIHSDLADSKNNRNESKEIHTESKPVDQNLSMLTNKNQVISYKDLDIFSNDKNTSAVEEQIPKKNILLCSMVEKYGVQAVKYCAKKVSDSITNSICKKIEDDVAKIIELPANEIKIAMNDFVLDLQNCNTKHFLSGFMKYLKDPARKIELFSKVTAPPVPPMTKSEQVLLYVLTELKVCWPTVDIVKEIMSNIEYTLFSLNRSPDFDIIESMSHFYAVLCRYATAKSRLRIFILDAMYCMQFKAVPLIKQCMDVWGHILPLAHMGIAKSPLVTCMVYLLHFYKCDDKFNRVQDIRNILKRKYFYQITDWNETKILEMFKNSIKDLKDIPAEKKMLRIALIILAKRHGPRWCQSNIIKNLLLPMIEKENTRDITKKFCVSVLGPLLKPYPNDMKVHCEIVINQLIDMLDQKQSPDIEEAIVTSLIYMNRHNQIRVNQALLSWRPESVSFELEEILRDYVKSKPVKIWKSSLSRLAQ